MRARYKLGQLLSEIDRAKGGAGFHESNSGASRPTWSYSKYVNEILKIGLTSAKEVQRIGAMPEADLQKAFAEERKEGDLVSMDDLVTLARPYWYIARRKQRHRTISAKAKAEGEERGPFPLIYCDPPWKFATYSEKGTGKTPDQHYPTRMKARYKLGILLAGLERDKAHAPI